uniref:protein delta homolog 2 n=1 Tax=Solea senegalensis TaxID=28829 RepID=UPI001CD87756|nr:protein delta homolog 2 [Solea senegalensis]
MFVARATAALTLAAFSALSALIAPPCSAQETECRCNVSNSRCDDAGVCRCDPGWDGELCDRCVLMPGCVHGSCQQPWQCSCDVGWAGRFCDKDLSVCSRLRPCQNGASCVTEDSGEYACLCPDSFHGRNCHLKAGPCHQRRSPCKNGGLCEDADGFAAALTCRCLVGFTGPRCETDVDDCLMMPCGNGATCVDGVNRFSCLCPTGFTGRFCTVNTDDCVSQPCVNGGRCLDRAGGFHCLCAPGYTGATCDTPLNCHDGWEGGGGEGGVRHHLTTAEKNYRTNSNGSRHGDRLFRVTVSEHVATSLSDTELAVVLVLAALTLGAVVLTAAFILQGHRRDCGHAPCWTVTSPPTAIQKRWRAQQDEPEQPISFLNATEPEKKKLNTEVV